MPTVSQSLGEDFKSRQKLMKFLAYGRRRRRWYIIRIGLNVADLVFIKGRGRAVVQERLRQMW